MAVVAAGATALNMSLIDLTGLLSDPGPMGASQLRSGGATGAELRGSFSYGPGGALSGGVLTSVRTFVDGVLAGDVSGFSAPALSIVELVRQGNTPAALQVIFGGDDQVTGSELGDLLQSHAGNDAMKGGRGNDSAFGGDGNDWLDGEDGDDFLRGEAGDDDLRGGAGKDDLHGNMGRDIVRGGRGDDWVVGGKDEDLLSGDEDNDLVFGNMGNDTCEGGEGADTVRGGQGDDLVLGGTGDDWLSGDRGSDTLTGGGGADIFNFFGGADIDRVTDFNLAEGDRVRIELAEGETYTVRQEGADAVVQVGSAQLVLVGVQASSLTDGWLTTQ